MPARPARWVDLSHRGGERAVVRPDSAADAHLPAGGGRGAGVSRRGSPKSAALQLAGRWGRTALPSPPRRRGFLGVAAGHAECWR
eukprot:scaffold130988_cov30-Tisochrysis_lutea.AAC.1